MIAIMRLKNGMPRDMLLSWTLETDKSQALPDHGGRLESAAEGGKGIFGLVARWVPETARVQMETILTGFAICSYDCITDAHRGDN